VRREQVPELGTKIPSASLDAKVPNLEGKLPSGSVEGKLPDVDVKLPSGSIDGKLPDVDVKLPSGSIEGKLPNLEGKLPSGSIEGKLPDVDVKLPSGSLDAKLPGGGIKGEVPSGSLKVPEAALGAAAGAVTAGAALAGAELGGKLGGEAPEVSANLPSGSVEVCIPPKPLPPFSHIECIYGLTHSLTKVVRCLTTVITSDKWAPCPTFLSQPFAEAWLFWHICPSVHHNLPKFTLSICAQMCTEICPNLPLAYVPKCAPSHTE
jgi:hypothetical protein